MRLHRFNTNKPLGDSLHIDDPDLINQWKNVLRFQVGETVVLFNEGSGEDYVYVIDEFQKKFVSLTYQDKFHNVICANDVKILILSIIKKESFDLAVRMAVEVGVTDIYPLNVSRSQKYSTNNSRIQKILTEAAEQSGRGDIPMFHDVINLDQVIALNKTHKLVFGALRDEVKQDVKQKADGVIVGPEGGFTDEEESFLQHNGVQAVTLGRVIRRAETASINMLITFT